MSDSHYIPRLIAESIQKFPRDKTLVLFGARQIGKATLLNTLFSVLVRVYLPVMNSMTLPCSRI